MIPEYSFKQNSPEWDEARRGIPTASNFGKILTSRGERSKQRQDYLYKLAGETIAKRTDAQYYGDTMKRGHEIEPMARGYFELKHGVEIDTPALCFRDVRKLYACSPDGLISGKEEGLEIKSPELTAAVKYLDKRKLPAVYVPQVQGSLMITGYDAWWFLSYCPGLKHFELRVERDERLITLYHEAVEEFCHDLKRLVDRVSP